MTGFKQILMLGLIAVYSMAALADIVSPDDPTCRRQKLEQGDAGATGRIGE
jgi:hypothetical protein